MEYATSCSFLNNDGVGPPVETCRLSPAAIRSASAINSCFCLGVKVGERLIRDLVVWAALESFASSSRVVVLGLTLLVGDVPYSFPKTSDSHKFGGLGGVLPLLRKAVTGFGVIAINYA